MVDRLPTGVEGLDRIIQGGFPRGTVNLVSGPAGSGKTLLGLHFVYTGAALYGQNVVYLSLEESRNGLDKVLEAYGMETAALESNGKFTLLDLGELRLGVKTTEYMLGFRELQDFLRTSMSKNRVDRLVVDSLSAAGLHYTSRKQLREELFSFGRFLRERYMTSLLISESIEGLGLTRWGFEQFVADSFIHLGLEEIKGELRRTLTIRKMRLTRHDTVKHPMRIAQGGMVVEADERVV